MVNDFHSEYQKLYLTILYQPYVADAKKLTLSEGIKERDYIYEILKLAVVSFFFFLPGLHSLEALI